MSNDNGDEPWVEVPWQQLPADTLAALVGEFVARDGTDYGDVEASHDSKVAQVREQLRRGEVLILFDPVGETVDLLSRREFEQRVRRFRAGN